MKVCAKGHQYRGDENYRARHGKCPICFREVQRRYNRSEKGRARGVAYDNSEKGIDRNARYDQSPKGWLRNLRYRRWRALERRKHRTSAEDEEE